MFTKAQEEDLARFADLSDTLFNHGVLTTDSFTGEIGEYIACQLFDLKKSNRVTQAVDGVSKNGDRYQVKSKITSTNFNYYIKNLNSNLFDYLVVVYFDKEYNPIKIIRVPSRTIAKSEIRITNSTINKYDHFDSSNLKISETIKHTLNDFAVTYDNLEKNGIIRSRRIVGDIGEFYASSRLNLQLSDSKNEKGIDARNENGLTFEIKTRRVYQSGRRISETRRLNNLVNKSADYLIVVTLDRSFKCSGMWIMPLGNIQNPKSANLKIVNTTPGCLNIIPSSIPWLRTGEKFNGFTPNKNSSKKVPNKTVSNRIRKIPVSDNERVQVQVTYPIKETPANSRNPVTFLSIVVGVLIISFLGLIAYALFDRIFY